MFGASSPKLNVMWTHFAVQFQGTGFDEDPTSPQSAAAVAKARRMIHISVVVAFLGLVIVWPLLTLPAGVWSKGQLLVTISSTLDVLASADALLGLPCLKSLKHGVEAAYILLFGL